MQIVTSNDKMQAFEVEELGGSLRRLIHNAAEQSVTVPAQGDEPERTAWQYERYTTDVVCLQTPEGMEAAAGAWAAYIKGRDRDDAADSVRDRRDKLLTDCDWTVTTDAKTDKTAWTAYRQALRDVPEQAGFPYTVDWPVQPHE